MPRVKKNDDVLQLELRITPADGEQITDWKLTDDHLKFISFMEGGAGTAKALHYHCYIEYARSRTLLLKWIYSIAHCFHGETGNAVFFSRKPHSHTFGYICKSGTVACRHNFEQTTIDEWFQQSEEYLKSKETSRKRKQRKREEAVGAIKAAVIKGLKEHTISHSVDAVIDRLLSEFHNNNLALPSRSIMETITMGCLYHVDRGFVRSYYMKSFTF